MKVLIVGGGVAGLGIAWRLCLEGAQVEIVERGICGRGASWSAAGMIAPGGESLGEGGALSRFADRSKQRWPGFARELKQAAGVDFAYRGTGSIIVAESQVRAQALACRA